MADEQELMVLLAAGESLEFTAGADFKALSLILALIFRRFR